MKKSHLLFSLMLIVSGIESYATPTSTAFGFFDLNTMQIKTSFQGFGGISYGDITFSGALHQYNNIDLRITGPGSYNLVTPFSNVNAIANPTQLEASVHFSQTTQKYSGAAAGIVFTRDLYVQNLTEISIEYYWGIWSYMHTDGFGQRSLYDNSTYLALYQSDKVLGGTHSYIRGMVDNGNYENIHEVDSRQINYSFGSPYTGSLKLNGMMSIFCNVIYFNKIPEPSVVIIFLSGILFFGIFAFFRKNHVFLN